MGDTLTRLGAAWFFPAVCFCWMQPPRPHGLQPLQMNTQAVATCCTQDSFLFPTHFWMPRGPPSFPYACPPFPIPVRPSCSPDLISSTFAGCTDPLEKKQLAYLLARHGEMR